MIAEIGKCKHLMLLQNIVVLCFVFGNNWIALEPCVPAALFRFMEEVKISLCFNICSL